MMNEKLSDILTELRCYLEALYRERVVQIILYGSPPKSKPLVAADHTKGSTVKVSYQ